MSDKVNNIRESTQQNGETQDKAKICGVVRPISAMGDYTKEHWEQVADIVKAVAEEAGFEAKLVSDSPSVNIIHNDIVQHLHDYPLVVCDISGNNPNVMFELGLRLTFDKPTVIIKDDKTDRPFDISVINSLEYPRSLHYPSIVKFREELKNTLESTYKEAQTNPDYSPFLKHFKKISPSKLSEETIPVEEYWEKNFQDLKKTMDFILSTVQELSHKGAIPRKLISDYLDFDTAKYLSESSLFRGAIENYEAGNKTANEG